MSELQSFNLDIQDYTIAAGGYLELGKPADFFQIMQATGPVDVTFLHSESSVGMARGVGQGFRLGPLQNRFYGVKIYSATAQTLKLCFSSGKSPVDLSQVVSVTGTVSVVNGEMQRVLSGQGFIGAGVQTAVAAQYSSVQIFNPVANTKNLVVNKITVLTNGASPNAFTLSVLNSTLAGLAGAPGSMSSKLVGGAAPSGLIYIGSAAALPTSQLGLIGPAAAQESKDFPFTEPIILPPGWGLVSTNAGPNEDNWTTFQWIESPI